MVFLINTADLLPRCATCRRLMSDHCVPCTPQTVRARNGNPAPHLPRYPTLGGRQPGAPICGYSPWPGSPPVVPQLPGDAAPLSKAQQNVPLPLGQLVIDLPAEVVIRRPQPAELLRCHLASASAPGRAVPENQEPQGASGTCTSVTPFSGAACMTAPLRAAA